MVVDSDLDNQSEHVSKGQAHLLPCFSYFAQDAVVPDVKGEDEPELVEDAERPLNSYALAGAHLEGCQRVDSSMVGVRT